MTLHYDDGAERSYTLVGEDEADPAQGIISWISPIAQALIGAQVGDEVNAAGTARRDHGASSPVAEAAPTLTHPGRRMQ